MFQNVNVAKSAPFALLTIYQKSLYPPKVFKIAPISVNYMKFAQFANIQSEQREINKFRTNFNKSSVLFYRLS